MKINLKKVDQVEILTLQDNCIDFFAFKENNQMIQRPVPIKQTECGLELSTPPGAEHGWSSIISICNSDSTKHLLFDFGWSEHGAARNAELLGIDMNKIDMLALSHGHIDHFGGIKALYDQIKNPGIELVLHPAAFRNPRYGKVMGDKKLYQPCLTKEMLDQVGVTLKQTDKPTQLLERNCLFLTSIERKNSFETGMNDVFLS